MRKASLKDSEWVSGKSKKPAEDIKEGMFYVKICQVIKETPICHDDSDYGNN